MASYCKVILIGNLGRDAELRYTPAGKAVATVSIAIDDPSVKDESTGRPKTEWYRVKIWGKQAETLKGYLLKGKQIYVDGRLTIQRWDSKEGERRYTPEVSADTVRLLGSSGGQGAATRAPHVSDHVPAPSDELGQEADLSEDDIPF